MQASPTHRAALSFAAAFVAVSALAAPALAQSTHPVAEGIELLQPTLDAHGGLDRWRNQKTFTYTLTGFPLSEPMSHPNTHTFDLRHRTNRIDGQGFSVAFDGTYAWSTGPANSAGLPSRFVSLGSSYFLAMPFVFADHGAVVTDAGTVNYKGQPHRALNVGYRDGVGASAEDAYQLLIDPDTQRLVAVNHSVTEIGIERVTWGFPAWQQVAGLIVPARLEFAKGWDPDATNDGAFTEVTDVSFDTNAPDPSLYRPQVGSTIDQVSN